MILVAWYLSTRLELATWRPWRPWFYPAIAFGLAMMPVAHNFEIVYPLITWADRTITRPWFHKASRSASSTRPSSFGAGKSSARSSRPSRTSTPAHHSFSPRTTRPPPSWPSMSRAIRKRLRRLVHQERHQAPGPVRRLARPLARPGRQSVAGRKKRRLRRLLQAGPVGSVRGGGGAAAA